MIKFSIIVPVFKVEKYINECIDSVINQSFKDFELILVDDGSPDRCPEICDEYAKINNQIRVIHKQNGGLSEARNTGIKNAAGEYIIFLDSDDFLAKGSLKRLSECMEHLKKTDIIFCSMLLYSQEDALVYKDHKAYAEQTTEEISDIKVLVDLIKTQTIIWSASSSIFRRENLISNNIYFDKSLIGAEDLDFYINAILNSKTFYSKNIDVCVYRLRRVGSITTNLNIKAFYGQLYVRKKWFDYFYSLNIDINSKKIICSFFSSIYIMKIFELNKFAKSEKHELIKFIRDNSYLINYPTNLKYRIIATVYRIFGLEFGIWIQKLYHKFFSKKINIKEYTAELN